jgi:hypothetical protein
MNLPRNLPPTSPVRPDIASAITRGINIAVFTRELAQLHGITFVDNEIDHFAAAASRLSDAEVEPDETADLLVALYRAGAISNRDNMALYDAHLRQKAG